MMFVVMYKLNDACCYGYKNCKYVEYKASLPFS